MGLMGLIVVATMLLIGCGSDPTPDSFVFQNNSTRLVNVSVAVSVPSNTVQKFSLEPGEEWQNLKAFVEPLNYTYSPMATVAANRNGDIVVFTDR